MNGERIGILHLCIRTQYKPKKPDAIASGTAIPPDKPLSQTPALQEKKILRKLDTYCKLL